MKNAPGQQNGENADFGPLLNLSIWTLSVASTGFLSLRLWAKVQRGRSLWYDDHVLIAAWVNQPLSPIFQWMQNSPLLQISLIVSCIMQSIDVHFGFGKDSSTIEPSLVSTHRLVSVIAGFLLILAACWSKTSFALTLLRISHGCPRRWIIFVICTTNFFFAGSGLVHWVQCWPLRLLWEHHLEGHCIPRRYVNLYNIFVAAYSGVMDIALAMLPWIIFRNPDNLSTLDLEVNKMRRKEKIGISVAMSMGVL